MTLPRSICLTLSFALSASCFAASGKGVSIDAKETPLGEIVKLLAAQGGPSLVLDPAVAGQTLTFAAKAMPPSAALRWLCRTCNLAIFAGKDDRPTLTRPEAEPSADKEYNVSKLVTTDEASDALVSFIKKAIFVSHPGRGKAEDGTPRPALEAVCEKGKLKVAGTASVQREVLALLRAMSKVQPKRSVEEVRATYLPYETGLLAPRGAATWPKLTGTVSLEVAGVPAAEAAWALTSAANVSFYVDPWDASLNSVKVSLKAEKRALGEVASELATQLGAQRCWYDEAWLLVREDRRPLFDTIVVKAYNTSGAGFLRREVARVARQFLRGQQAVRGDLPFDLEHADDLLLIAGPAAWHEGAEDFVKNGPDLDRLPPPPPSRPHHRKGR